MIDYEEWYSLLGWQGSVVPKATFLALPTLAIAIFLSYLDEIEPNLRKDSGIYDITESQLWNAMTAVIIVLMGFRTKQAFGRFWEGTSLLHQMRGEWFDAASCLMAFSRDAKIHKNKAAEVKEFRHTLMRLMSLMHGSALDEISGCDDDRYEVLDIHGLDAKTLRFLRDCKEKLGFNRVEALQHMIQVLVTHNHHSGVLTIPPPILSRIYQTLSRGLVNLLNARKIKDTSFPFPYAQVILLLLCVHSVFTPLLMTQVIASKVWAALFSFFPILGLISINLIAAELEMPFGNDMNDLPLRHFQSEMNDALLLLIHEFADHLPHTSRQAKFSYDLLQNFARASVLRRAHISPSDSQSFLRKDFFLEINPGQEDQPEDKLENRKSMSPDHEVKKEPEKDPRVTTISTKQESEKGQVPMSATTTVQSAVSIGNVVATDIPPLQPVTSKELPKLALPAAGPEAWTALPEQFVKEPVSEKSSSPPSPTWIRQNEIEVVEAPYIQSKREWSCMPQSASICPVTPRGIGQNRPPISTPITPVDQRFTACHQEISTACKSLVQLTEVQVVELKYNTEVMRAFNKSYPDALTAHCEAMKTFTDTVSSAIRNLAPPAPPPGDTPMLDNRINLASAASQNAV